MFVVYHLSKLVNNFEVLRESGEYLKKSIYIGLSQKEILFLFNKYFKIYKNIYYIFYK